MSQKLAKKSQSKMWRYLRRKHRVNTTLKVTSSRPRLIVSRSNSHITAQVVDLNGNVVAFATSKWGATGTGIEKAYAVGEKVAKAAIDNNVEQVVFDRNGFLFHGRVAKLAEWARAGGLQF